MAAVDVNRAPRVGCSPLTANRPVSMGRVPSERPGVEERAGMGTAGPWT